MVPDTSKVDLSAWAAAVWAAGVYVGPTAAQYIGTYAVILAGWFLGAMIGLYRRQENAKLRAWQFVTITFLASMGTTVPAAQWAANHFPLMSLDFTALLFPVAGLIPATPNEWAWVGRKVAGRVGAMFGAEKGPQ